MLLNGSQWIKSEKRAQNKSAGLIWNNRSSFLSGDIWLLSLSSTASTVTLTASTRRKTTTYTASTRRKTTTIWMIWMCWASNCNGPFFSSSSGVPGRLRWSTTWKGKILFSGTVILGLITKINMFVWTTIIQFYCHLNSASFRSSSSQQKSHHHHHHHHHGPHLAIAVENLRLAKTWAWRLAETIALDIKHHQKLPSDDDNNWPWYQTSAKVI